MKASELRIGDAVMIIGTVVSTPRDGYSSRVNVVPTGSDEKIFLADDIDVTLISERPEYPDSGVVMLDEGGREWMSLGSGYMVSLGNDENPLRVGTQVLTFEMVDEHYNLVGWKK